MREGKLEAPRLLTAQEERLGQEGRELFKSTKGGKGTPQSSQGKSAAWPGKETEPLEEEMRVIKETRQRDREWGHESVRSRDRSLLSRAMSLMPGCQELSLPFLALLVYFLPPPNPAAVS